MSLAAGSRLGPYEILTALGAGGMGEVYRARDTKLNRDVALKVLPDSFANDPDRLARFQREAQVLASLNHPNIAHIHGLEDTGDVRAIVMELVEGEDLAQRLTRGAIPIDEALPIAKQIAEALEAAHEQGIVHRDLKPANIKVRDDGTVKVLDFGLAKLVDSVGAGFQTGPNVTQSPTITTPAMTAAGMILGTAAYMSPEQAKGRPADKRSDIWAFGCVLYEMLTGHRTFDTEDVSETLAAVLRAEPDWSRLSSNTPISIHRLLHRCLAKDPRSRIGDAAVLRLEIDEARNQPSTFVASVPPRPLWKRSLPSVASAVAAAAIATGIVWTRPPVESPRPVTRFSFPLPDPQRFTNSGRHLLAISPDGTRIVYVANGRLYLKALWDVEAAPIRGVESSSGAMTGLESGSGRTSPVFSPDGEEVAFWADGEIREIGIAGGTPVTLARDVINPFGMTWSGDAILVGVGPRGILRIPTRGGSADVLFAASEHEVLHGPQMLPDGRSVLFTVASQDQLWDSARIVVQQVGSTERKTVVEGGSDGRYLSSGHIIYVVGGVLFARRFDVNRLEAISAPQPVVEGIARATGGQTGSAQLAASSNGSLIFISGPTAGTQSNMDLAMVDRKGNVQPLKLQPQSYVSPRFSPKGQRIAVGVEDPKNENIWIYDVTGTAAPRQLTFGGKNRFPVWSPDGTRVAFQSDREGDLAIFWQLADGSAAAERLTKPGPGESHVADAFFPKGDRLLLSVRSNNGISLWTYSIADRKTEPFIKDVFVTLPHADVSPDGRWVAYEVGAGGARGGLAAGTLFVQPFPATGAVHRIGPGVNPFWAADGKALYSAVPNTLSFSVIGVKTTPSFETTSPILIPRPAPAGGGANFPRQYDVAANGEQFVIVVTSGLGDIRSRGEINVVLNWFTELQQRVPTR